jgi:hypothetical protein
MAFQVQLPARTSTVAKCTGVFFAAGAIVCQLVGWWPADALLSTISNAVTMIVTLVVPSALIRTEPK